MSMVLLAVRNLAAEFHATTGWWAEHAFVSSGTFVELRSQVVEANRPESACVVDTLGGEALQFVIARLPVQRLAIEAGGRYEGLRLGEVCFETMGGPLLFWLYHAMPEALTLEEQQRAARLRRRRVSK